MTHLWLPAESKPNEERTALTPDFAKQLTQDLTLRWKTHRRVRLALTPIARLAA
jgi:hypothetical protein